MRKADRLFQLTNLIRARQPVTAHQLAEELGVSVRSIYRYIDDLSVSGIPVYGIAGEGYRLYEGFELPPLNLTEKRKSEGFFLRGMFPNHPHLFSGGAEIQFPEYLWTEHLYPNAHC